MFKQTALNVRSIWNRHNYFAWNYLKVKHKLVNNIVWFSFIKISSIRCQMSGKWQQLYTKNTACELLSLLLLLLRSWATSSVLFRELDIWQLLVWLNEAPSVVWNKKFLEDELGIPFFQIFEISSWIFRKQKLIKDCERYLVFFRELKIYSHL